MRVSCIAYLSASPLVVAEDGRKERASQRERVCQTDRQSERERQTDRPTKLIFIIKTAALGPFGQPVLCILQTQLSTNEQYVKTLQTDN